MRSTLQKPDVKIDESLDVYNDPHEPTVDIVVIPGLGANPVKSWEWGDAPHFNWVTEKITKDDKDTGTLPRDIKDIGGLAKDCPTARVLLYSYASAYQGNYQIEQYMTNIVSTLLNHLKAKREGERDSQRRPLVLVGHSMGGLVIAKALLMADSRRDQYPNMYEAVVGCLFFGTPFNGAPVADIADQWVEINERLGKATNRHLIDLLTPGNETLKELKDEFVRSVNKLERRVQVHCFWERQETSWEKVIEKLADQDFPPSLLKKLSLNEYRQFVSRESATLPGMDCSGLPRNHRDLVRFKSDKDPAYLTIRNPLREIVNAAPRIARARFNDARKLSIDPQNYRKKTTSQSWIVRDKLSHYVDWLENTDRLNDYLWIHGAEGQGKSAAAAAIIDATALKLRRIDESTHQSPHLLAYFFCEASPNYCTADDVIKSLLQQLCQQQEILATYATQFLQKELEENELRPEASLSIENLWQSLQKMLCEESVGTMYFIINNLHELDNSPSTDKLLSFIQEDIMSLSSNVVGKNIRGRKVRTKWLFTSRAHKAMRATFGLSEVRSIDLDASEYGDQQKQALKKYAWAKAEELRKKKNYDLATTYFMGSVIVKLADNTKWIDIAIVQLAASPAETSESETQRILQHLPEKFTSLLEAAWKSILSREDKDIETIREILRVLLFTYEDPTERELILLAHLSTEGDTAMLQKLINKCQGLVTTRGPENRIVVGFVNAEVKKHLRESKQLLGIGDERTRWQHGKMSLRCFSHILSVLRKAIGGGRVDPETDDKAKRERKSNNTQSSTDRSLDESNMTEKGQATRADWPLEYATRYWLRHASEATMDVSNFICRERSFWKPDSQLRQRWISSYQELTHSLSAFGLDTWRALHVASSVGFPRLVTALINEGYNSEVFEYNSKHKTPLHLAAFYGDVEIVEILLKEGSPVDDAGPMKTAEMTPLAMAAAGGQVGVMKQLISDWKANINAIDGKQGPILNHAIRSGNTEAVNLLLKHEAQVNYSREEARVAPLAMSAYHSDLKMFSTILEGAKGKFLPMEFDKAMIWASAAGKLDILERLLVFGHQPKAYQFSLEHAREEMHWEACLMILRHPPARGLNCEALSKRAAIGIETLTEVLQACFDNSHITQETLDNSLYEATDKEKESTVELLLKLGANPNAIGDEFGNALTASANDGTDRILSLLLDAGASVMSSTGFALQQASDQGHLKVVELLLSNGANVNEENGRHPSCTALQAACDSGHAEVVKFLLGCGADPNLGGGKNTRPIFGAIRDGGEEILKELLRASGLELDVIGGPFNGTPLYTAALTLPAETTALLIEHGATIDYEDDDGDTALMGAVHAGDADVLRLFIERGADFLKISKRNETALQLALQKRQVDCINLLLERTDFMLRDLQRAAEVGDNGCQTIISSEKRGRKKPVEDPASQSETDGKQDDTAAIEAGRSDTSKKFDDVQAREDTYDSIPTVNDSGDKVLTEDYRKTNSMEGEEEISRKGRTGEEVKMTGDRNSTEESEDTAKSRSAELRGVTEKGRVISEGNTARERDSMEQGGDAEKSNTTGQGQTAEEDIGTAANEIPEAKTDDGGNWATLLGTYRYSKQV